MIIDVTPEEADALTDIINGTIDSWSVLDDKDEFEMMYDKDEFEMWCELLVKLGDEEGARIWREMSITEGWWR